MHRSLSTSARPLAAFLLTILLLASAPVLSAAPSSGTTTPQSVTSISYAGLTSDGEALKINCATWSACRNATSGGLYSNLSQGTVQARHDAGGYQVKRLFLFFNTASLPDDATITQVRLRLYLQMTGAGRPLHVVRSTAGQPLTSADFDAVVYQSGGSLAATSTGWAELSFSPAAFTWVVRDGVTGLALLHADDLNDQLPIDDAGYLIRLGESTGYRPLLDVTYTTGQAQPSSVGGRVSTALGAGMAGVTVATNTGASAQTAADGSYTIADLAPGTYTLTASKPGYSFSAPRTITVPPGVTGQDFTGQADAPYFWYIGGRVTDSDGVGVGQVEIRANGLTLATTDAYGYYGKVIGAGTYEFTAVQDGYVFTGARTLTVPPEHTSVDFVRKDRVVILVHGWQGVNFSNWQGITGGEAAIFKCEQGLGGYAEALEEFGGLAEMLNAQGYKVYMARWTTGPKQTEAISVSADCIGRQIAGVIGDDGDGKVTIIAHSMGGLVSRAYIKQGGAPYVDRLITLGTPHVGVKSGTFSRLLLLSTVPGASVEEVFCATGSCQLFSSAVSAFNRNYPPSPTVAYHMIAGTGGSTGILGNLISSVEGPNDGIVGTRSATGRPSPSENAFTPSSGGRWLTADKHTSALFGSAPAYVSVSSEAIPCVRQILGLQGLKGCTVATTAAAPALAAAPAELSYAATITGTLAAGETRALPVRLDGSQATVMAAWQTGALTLTLRRPDGVTLDPATVATLHAGGQFEQGGGGEWPRMAGYTLPAPPTGEWVATLTAGEAATDFVIFGAVESTLRLSFALPGSTDAGAEVQVEARLSDGGAPLGGALVAAQLAGGTASPVPLSEVAASPGLYRGAIVAPAQPGPHLVQVRASVDGATREAESLLNVRSAGLQPAGAPTVRAIDDNGNGRFDRLRLELPYTFAEAGGFVAEAILRAPDGAELTRGRAELTVGPGASVVSLDIDGRAIHAAGVAGPYSIDLLIAGQTTLLVAVDAPGLLQTAAYTADQFELPAGQAQVFLPSVRR